MGRKKFFNFKNLFLVSFLAVAGIFSSAAIVKDKQVEDAPMAEKADATDYSKTIRVYVDLSWGGVDYVRVGTDQASGNAILTSTNTTKYNQSYKYVRDISSSSKYDNMGCFFWQECWWAFKDNGGYIPSPGGWGFSPGNEYLIKNISYVSGSGPKYFNAEAEYLGPITENVNNPTVYFVNGYSWTNPYVNYWGGTASVAFPGSKMNSTSAKLHCKVGDSWFDIGIYKYSISGSAAFIQFNKGDDTQQTDRLRPINGGIYYYGTSSETFGEVASFLVSFINSMGSYTYEGKTYPESICYINSSAASPLITKYNSLSTSETADVVTSVLESKINTYSTPVTNPSTKSDIVIPDLINQINKNVSRTNGAIKGFTPFDNILNEENNVATVIIIIASSVSLLSITALSVLIVKKRKTKEE